MKKQLIFALAALTALLCPLTAGAEENAEDTQTAAEITVNISVTSKGENVVARQDLAVKDADTDGSITVKDAIICAHTAFYEGGAEAGFAVEKTTYGDSIVKLWGVENGYSYGFYIDNQMAMSLTDPISEGQLVDVFSYVDAEGASDQYTWFDAPLYTGKGEDETYTATLNGLAFDENWTPVTVPVAGAVLTVDGTETEFVTDENGQVTFKAPAGDHILSAKTADKLIVPPTAEVQVKPNPAEVYVSVITAGEIQTAMEEVEVSDKDGDFMLTVYDALVCTHEQLYEGGAAGFDTVKTQYGTTIVKLWGIENGYGYGYYLNDTFASSIYEQIEAEDLLTAFTYQDLENYSDVYTYFKVDDPENMTVQLVSAVFDGNETKEVPLAGAVITLNGEETDMVTDENGYVTIDKDEIGTYVVSAAVKEGVIVPPVQILTVSEQEEEQTTEPAETTTTAAATTTTAAATTKAAAVTTAPAKSAGPDTGDRSQAGIALTALLAMGAAFALRRRDA